MRLFAQFYTSHMHHHLSCFCTKVGRGCRFGQRRDRVKAFLPPSLPLLTLTQLCPCHLSSPQVPHHHHHHLLHNLLVRPQFGKVLAVQDIIGGLLMPGYY